jgi:hypothetical protein
MSSYWDRTDERRRLIQERARDNIELQLKMWGWSDERLRDACGRLVNPKPGKRGQREARS